MTVPNQSRRFGIETSHALAQVIIKRQDEAEAAFEKHKAQLAKVNAWSLQLDSLKYDMKKSMKRAECLVRTAQTPESSPEMRATIDAIDTLDSKFKEVRLYRTP